MNYINTKFKKKNIKCTLKAGTVSDKLLVAFIVVDYIGFGHKQKSRVLPAIS